MDLRALQTRLAETGRYAGAIDGIWGRLTRAAILRALADGPDTRLTRQDLEASAARLGVTYAAIKAVDEVEAAGTGFQDGYPKILPEPHRFSRATQHRFDRSHPNLSYPTWGQRPYPRLQAARYDQLVGMIELDIDAGFASASYGRFQILGENHAACGYRSSFAFAEAMARDEATQLKAFEGFLAANGLIAALKRLDWAAFARGYNGTAYRKNKYDEKLAAAHARAVRS